MGFTRGLRTYWEGGYYYDHSHSWWLFVSDTGEFHFLPSVSLRPHARSGD